MIIYLSAMKRTEADNQDATHDSMVPVEAHIAVDGQTAEVLTEVDMSNVGIGPTMILVHIPDTRTRPARRLLETIRSSSNGEPKAQSKKILLNQQSSE